MAMRTLCVMLALAGAIPCLGAEQLLLAQGGRTAYRIVVDTPQAVPQELQAAKELGDYLGRMTGAKLPVVEEGSGEGTGAAIYVGDTAAARAAGIKASELGAQQARVKTVGKNLILAGGRPWGTLFAVYRFLEDYGGCRWYTVWDEVVPSRATLTVPALDRTWTPAFKYRTMYRQGGHQKGPYGGENEWCARNRFVGETVGAPPNANTCHTYVAYFDPKQYLAEHPEYCSLMGGKRVAEGDCQFCQTNPEVRKIVLERLKQVIRDNPTADYYEVSTNDGNQGRCQCPTCLALEQGEGKTAPFMDFINSLADGIKDEFPRAVIRTFSYNVTREPTKTMKYRPNVALRLCDTGPDWLALGERTKARLQAWGEQASRLYIWDYDGLAHGQVFPAPGLEGYVDRFRYYQRSRVEGVFLESELLVSPRSLVELRQWVYMKLAEDPGKNLWGLVDDFCRGMYGPAAPQIVAYAKLIESRQADYPWKMFDFAFLTRAQGLLETAAQAAAGNPRTLARVQEARFNLDLVTLWYWSKAISDHVRAGGKVSDWKLDRERILARVEPWLGAFQKEGRWLSALPDWPADRRQATEKAWYDHMQQTVVEPALVCGRAAKGNMALPVELAGVDPKTVVELPAPVFGFCDGRGPFYEKADDRLPVADPEAASGVAYFLSQERFQGAGGVLPFTMGNYDSTGRVGGGGRVKAEDIKAAGYHLYKLGRFALSDTCYIYLTGAWALQARNLGMFLDPKTPDLPWDVYVSLKTSGPNLPFGDKQGKDGAYLDRLLLVPVPSDRRYSPESVAAARKGENLVVQGGFPAEAGAGLPAYLAAWCEPKDSAAGVKVTVGGGALTFARSSDQGNAFAAFREPIPVQPGRDYLFTALVTAGFNDDRVSFAFDCLDEKRQPVGQVKLEPVTRYLGIAPGYLVVTGGCLAKLGEASEAQAVVTMPEQARFVKLTMGYGFRVGTVRVAGVKLEEIGK